MTHIPDRLQADTATFTRRMLAFADAVVLHGINWIRDWRYAEEHRHYLDELDRRGELEGLLEVTGATREQLKSSELSPLAAFELLHRMMRKLGIDPATADAPRPALSEAEWRCRMCPNWRQCRHWLDEAPADDKYRDFCSNAALLERLRTQRASET